MRTFLANLIVVIAKLVSLPLSSRRRMDTCIRVRQGLETVVQVKTEAGQIRFHGDTRWILSQIWEFEDNEPDMLAWIAKMPDSACFWDIGANIGAFSLYAALIRRARVLAFEPSGSTFSILNRNIELNGVSELVSGYCLAFAGETKLGVLNMAGTGAGRAMHGFETEFDQFNRPIETKFRQGTIGFSVDDFVNHFSPPRPTHVKIDVDGIEADILGGGRVTLSDPSVRSMIVEVEGDPDLARNRKIFSLMREFGFTAKPKISPECRNVVFDRM